MTRSEKEQALDAGKLYVRIANSWWRLRRNGKTQTWKREPSRYRIPVKAGLKTYGALDEHDDYELRISDTKPTD